MDRQRLSAFADACQVLVGRVTENPDASHDLFRRLLDAVPHTLDARSRAVIDGLTVRMLERTALWTKVVTRPVERLALPAARTEPDGAAPTDFRVTAVLTYLEEAFADPTLRLSSAAERATLSPAYLARLLKTETGLTFLQHLRRIRLGHAEAMLLTTTLSIKQTAFRCGYTTTGSFDRDFRRAHLCAPSVWRRRQRG